MKQLEYTRNLLFVLIGLYFAQGALYARGSIISQIALFSILAISGIFLVKTLLQKKNKNSFYNAFTALLLLNIGGFIFTGDASNSTHFSQFKVILIVALPFYPFYYLAQRSILQEKHLIRFFLLVLPLSIIGFYTNQVEVLSQRISGNEDLVNNAAYTFVFLIPFVFLFKQNKLLSIVAMSVLFFFIIQGAKRGALITGAIGALYFAYYHLVTIHKKDRFKGYLFVIIGIVGLSLFAYDFYQNNEYLVARMSSIGEEGGSSGRDRIYANLFNAWYNSANLLNLLFGSGFASTLKASGTGHLAHNDWLELLTNFGLLGVLVYATMFYSVLKFAFSAKIEKDKKILTLTIVSMWFFTTLVSMNYTSSNALYQSMLLAFLLGAKNNNRKIVSQ